MALDPRIAELEENLRQWERRNGRRLIMATLLPILVVGILGWFAFNRIERVEGPVSRVLDSLAVPNAEDPSARLGILAQEVRQLRDQAARATAAEQRRADAARELEQLRSGVDGKRQELEASLQDSIERLAQTEASRDIALARVQQLQTSLTAATGTSGQAAGRLSELERTVAMVTNARDVARRRAAELDASMAAAVQDKSVLTAELEAANIRLKDLQEQLAVQQARSSELGTQVAQLDSRLAGAENRAARSEERANAAAMELAALERTRAAEAKAAAAPDPVVANDARSDELRQQIATLEQRLRDEADLRNAAEGRLAALAAERQAAAAGANEARQLEEEVRSLREQLAATQAATASTARPEPLEQLEASLDSGAAGAGAPTPLSLDAVVLNDGLFAPASDVLSASGKAEIARISGGLRRLVEVLPASRPWRIRIDGHTDDVPVRSGRFSSNWSLSSARASSVAAALVADGLPPSRIMTAGFADTKPVSRAGTEEARRLNRRIEIKVVDP